MPIKKLYNVKYRNHYIKLENQNPIIFGYIVNKEGKRISRAIIDGNTESETIAKAKKYIDRVIHYNYNR